MVLAVRPVIELVKVPVPVPPLLVHEFEVVGLAEMLQQTPRAAIGDPPSTVMLPPEVAVVCVMELTATVVTAGTVTGAKVVNVKSLP